MTISWTRNKGSCNRNEMVVSDLGDLHLVRCGLFQVFQIWRCWCEAAAALDGCGMLELSSSSGSGLSQLGTQSLSPA